MTTALLWYDTEPKPAKAEEFKRVASELGAQFHCLAHPVHTGKAMVDAARLFEPGSVDHLICNMHGFTTRLLCSSAGVHATTHHPPRVVSIAAFVDAWRPYLADVLKVSLCACMCSRTPTATLRKLLGRAFGSWDPLIHENGGVDSFSGLLRDALAKEGIEATVRGHTTAAHVTHNPALREHGPVPREPGRSLFHIALEPLGETITGSYDPAVFAKEWRACKKFNNLVKGPLAERWVTFDDTAVADIRARW